MINLFAALFLVQANAQSINLGLNADGTPIVLASVGSVVLSTAGIAIGSGIHTINLSTSGFSGGSGPITFSSNVVIQGDLRVNSTKAKAIFLPTRGIHLDDGVPSAGATAPGQMFAKNIVTSTITFKGSAMIWTDSSGVAIATFTSTLLDMNVGTIRGKIQSNNSGPGAPALADCNTSTVGTFYQNTLVPKLNYCRADGTWGIITMTNGP